MALGAIGGLLAGPALPRTGIWFAIFASVALIHLAIRHTGFWAGAGIGVVAGFALYYSQSEWMTAYLGPLPLAALALVEALVVGLGLGLAAGIWSWLNRHRKRLGARYQLFVAIWLPLIWVAREWASCHFPYGGYQWSQLGQAVADTGLAQLAFWGGIPLVSLAVAMLAIGVVLWLEAKPWRVREAATYWRRSLAALGPSALILLLALFTPMAQSAVFAGHEASALRVVSVQGNANAGLLANPNPGSIFVKHLGVTEKFIAENGNKSLALMVWPENSVDLSPLTHPLVAAELQSLTDRLGAPLLIGSVVERGPDMLNESILYTPGSSTQPFYDKRRPVPFGEYVPDRAFYRALAPQLIDLIYRGYTPGKRVGTFDTAGTRIGALICFEIGIDEITHDLVTHGSRVIVSQANNADFGHTDEAFQQEALLRLQAIATGRPIIHASTVATTEIVTASGEVLSDTKAFTPGWAEAAIHPNTAITPAMACFGWLDYLALALAIIAALILLDLQILRWVSGKSQKRKIESSETPRKAALKTLVIMPTYNEAESIRKIAGGLLTTVDSVDLLIVDDNSPDGTGKIADQMALANQRVKVLHRTEKNGLGPAYLAGFAWGFDAGYDYLVEMDADGSHRAEDLLAMLAAAPNYDLVIGSRWVKGGKVVNWPLSRQLISRTGNLYARTVLRAGIRDITAGFRVFNAEFLKSLDLSAIASAGYSFQVEMAWRCYKANARIHEVPITFVEREAGYSKMSKKIVFEALWRVTQWGLGR